MQCPNCGVELSLAVVMETKDNGNKTDAEGKTINFRMEGKPYSLADKNIVEAAKKIDCPGTIREYFVKLTDRQGTIKEYPIKQVVREALRTVYQNAFSENYFTSQRAKHILVKLGFAVNKKI